METQLCKNFEKCPIFNGILGGKEATINGYKKKYCTNTAIKGWQSCKRYMVKEKTGKCPPTLLPNSMQNIDDIIKNMD
jgi:hypothetical protein